jgi:hypothetical protein
MNLDETSASPTPPSKEIPEERGKPGKIICRCDLCGSPMLDLHCKLICLRCGFKRDCSDP